MIELARLGVFLLFVALGLRLLASRPPAARRRATVLFVAYAAVAGGAAAVTQLDAWPFSSYRLIQGLWGADRVYSQIVLRGVDGSGREWAVDPLAWSPAFPHVIHSWLEESYPTLSATEQATAAAFLLDRAEDARRRRLRGQPVGNTRRLGPLTAPDWWLSPPVQAVAPTPFTRLRAYRVFTRVHGTPQWDAAQLVLEHPRP